MSKSMSIICAICHDFLFTGKEDESICSTSCGHVYHYPCLLQWLESMNDSSKLCPHCRTLQSDNTIIKLNLNLEETSAVRSQELTKMQEELHRIKMISDAQNFLQSEKKRELEKRNNELADQVKRLQDSETDLECQLVKVKGELQDQHAAYQLRVEIQKWRTEYYKLEKMNKELTDRVEGLQNFENKLLSQLKIVTGDLENHQNTFRMKWEECRSDL
ncbi:E3 ubiquitin-protein ligase TRAIP-like [Planococcus citri]|uniref:E3 ubiquitin-protein ligase TRAIP-like n=1 Tax=Planococcus citri TaxID=170843 RepID=UPI0031F9ADF0